MSELKEVRLLDHVSIGGGNVFISVGQMCYEVSELLEPAGDTLDKLSYVIQKIDEIAIEIEDTRTPTGITENKITLYDALADLIGLAPIMIDYLEKLRGTLDDINETLDNSQAYSEKLQQDRFIKEIPAYINELPETAEKRIKQALENLKRNDKRLKTALAETPTETLIATVINDNLDAIGCLEKIH